MIKRERWRERRFNLREREKVIEAFTTTLREEIDLDQLREPFLTVILKTCNFESLTDALE